MVLKICFRPSFKISSLQFLSSIELLKMEEGAFFYSGAHPQFSNVSFLCLFTEEIIRVCRGETLWQTAANIKKFSGAPWDCLKNIIDTDCGSNLIPHWVGYFGYEMACSSEAGCFIDLPFPSYDEAHFRKFIFIAKYDHNSQNLCFYYDEEKLSKEQKQKVQEFKDESFWKEAKKTKLVGDLQVISDFDAYENYAKKIAAIKDKIKDGIVYQLNLSHRCQWKASFSLPDLFKNLCLSNPVPFSVFLNYGKLQVASLSPERLLKKEQDRIVSFPIKGTAPRGKNLIEDLAHRDFLLSSEKNFSELLMITDLLRNDLSKIALKGSVETKSIAELMTLSNVFHLVSKIQARVCSSLHPIDIIRACFPGGSITGCPKISVMQEIAAIEKRPRGCYTGSIGYFAKNGDFDFNIAIRTLTKHEEILELSLGGGIVIDSEPLSEYEETFHKGSPILNELKKIAQKP